MFDTDVSNSIPMVKMYATIICTRDVLLFIVDVFFANRCSHKFHAADVHPLAHVSRTVRIARKFNARDSLPILQRPQRGNPDIAP